jgi:hypothetical protein
MEMGVTTIAGAVAVNVVVVFEDDLIFEGHALHGGVVIAQPFEDPVEVLVLNMAHDAQELPVEIAAAHDLLHFPELVRQPLTLVTCVVVVLGPKPDRLAQDGLNGVALFATIDDGPRPRLPDGDRPLKLTPRPPP